VALSLKQFSQSNLLGGLKEGDFSPESDCSVLSILVGAEEVGSHNAERPCFLKCNK
jgi:hypothetical protein